MAFYLIRILIGVLFVFSAYAKQFSIEGFETQVYDVIGNWQWSAYVARGIILIEYLLGFSLLLIYRKWLLNLSLVLMISFSLYLIWQLLFDQKKENCGCFGELIEMSSAESLIKNLVLLTLIILVLKKHPPSKWLKWSKLVYLITTVASISVLLYFSPLSTKDVQTDLNWSIEQLQSEIQSKLPKNGILAFFTPNCKHCKSAAIRLNKLTDSEKKITMIFMTDKKEDALEFILETDVNLNYRVFGSGKFLDYSGNRLPAIYAIKNSQIVNYWNGRNLNAASYHLIDSFLHSINQTNLTD